MEELKLLPKHYQDYHSTSDSGITLELLVKEAREFLSTVKPKERFMHLGSYDFYENVLGKIVEKSEGNKESIQMITTGLSSLEKYGVNLWKFPWRKEYHTIKLYTAFFKCNVGQNLQDRETILELLNSLGYTVMEQQKVVIKELDKERAIWTSLTLFLAQVDLQVIKEIMDHFPDDEYTLKEIVRARSKTPDVGTAVYYLRRKASKRRKIEEEPSDVPSHERTKDTHIGRVEVMNNLQPETRRSDEVTSADQNTRRPSKRSALSKGREDVAAVSDDSLTGSTVSKTHPSVSTSTGVKIPTGTTGGRHFTSMNIAQIPEHDLYGASPQAGQQQHTLDARYSTAPPAGRPYDATKYASDRPRYSTFPQTGSLNDANQPALDALYDTSSRARALLSGNAKGNLRYHTESKDENPPHYDNIQYRMDAATTSVTVTPSHSSHQQANRSYRGFVSDDMWRNSAASQNVTVAAMTTNTGNQSMMSTRTATQKHGSSRDSRYANLRDLNSSADQQFGSHKLDEPVSAKDSMRRLDDMGVKDGRARHSSSELKKVEQREPSRGSRNDASQYYNGAAEEACERSAAQSGITDLDSTLKRHLTLDPTKQVSGVSTEGIATRSRDRITNEAQSTRPYESNFTATKEVGKDTGSSAADITSHSAKKIQAKGSSPVPLRKTSAKEDWSQNPAHSSKNDPDTKASQKAMAHQTNVKADTICHHCLLQGTIICKNCFRILCRKCKYIYTTDHCDATKGDHAFVDIRDNIRHQMKSVDSKASSSQHYANVNESFGDWPCTRCTYLNPPDHGICVMCAASRGVGTDDDPKPGSKVCRNCTLNNEEGAKVCVACDKTLCNSETVV